MSLQYNGKDEWVSVVDCYFCLLQKPTKETTIIPIDYDYFGTKGKMLVSVCKKCHRNHQLKKLID